MIENYTMAAKEVQTIHDEKEPTASGIESPIPDAGEIGFDKKATKKLLRKIDITLVPLVALLYKSSLALQAAESLTLCTSPLLSGPCKHWKCSTCWPGG